jgi:hypothetical protein
MRQSSHHARPARGSEASVGCRFRAASRNAFLPRTRDTVEPRQVVTRSWDVSAPVGPRLSRGDTGQCPTGEAEIPCLDGLATPPALGRGTNAEPLMPAGIGGNDGELQAPTRKWIAALRGKPLLEPSPHPFG